MAERGWKAAALGVAGVICLALASAGAGGLESFKTSEAAEKFLREASVVSVERDAQSGRTLPWIVSLEKNGVKARAVFRYVHRPRPHPLAHSYRYELAAYELGKLLELEIVPPTVARTIEGTPGALQLYVEGCVSERDFARAAAAPPDPQALRNSLDTVRLFEGLAGDACGNKDDTFIHKDTWKACRVDLAEAFPPEPALSEDCLIERCPKSLYERMLRMDPVSTKRKLRAWLSDSEIDGLCGRKRQIVAGLMELIKTKGEAAVLYPPQPRP
jgi:hypothetical protein